MRAGALFDDRNRAAHAAGGFEKAQHDDRVGEIGHIDRLLHVADHAVLRECQKGRRAAPVQVLQQLVQLEDDVLLLRHRRLIAVEAVDRDDAGAFGVEAAAYPMRKFPWRQFRSIDLLDHQLTGFAHLRQIEAEFFGARQQQAELLVEYEERRPVARGDRRRDVLQHEQRFADARRTDDQRARPGGQPAPGEIIEFRDAALDQIADKPGAVLGGDQTREQADAVRTDREVMVAAAKGLGPTFDDANPPPLAAIGPRQLIEMDDAVRDAVHGAVNGLGGQIIEQHDRRLVAREIMLQREDLAPVAQRALRQKADLGQAVDDDALWLQPLDRGEDALNRLAELEVGGVEEALMLIRVEETFRRYQLHDLDIRAEGPAMRGGAVAQFLLGLGQADIHADLAGFRPRHQKLQGDRRLAGAGAPLEKVQPVAGEPPVHDLVEPRNAGGGPRQDDL